MENEYAHLIEQAQSFIDLLQHTPEDSDAAGGGEPRVEKIDFDQLREMLAAVRDKLDAARKIENEMDRIRRKLAARIDALRRGKSIIANNGRPADDSHPADDISLDELIRTLEAETGRLHHGAATPARTAVASRKAYRDYGEFK